MNEAVNQHIGGTKRRNKGDALDNDDAGNKATADLEKHIDSVKSYFFKDGLQMVIDGYSLEELSEILSTSSEIPSCAEPTTKAMGFNGSIFVS